MINITIIIPIGFGCLIAGGGLVLFFVKHPEVIDKWLSIIYKLIRFIYKGAGEIIPGKIERGLSVVNQLESV